MNCLESQEQIQRCLDGEPVATDWGDFTAHLLVCPECREQYAAAQCLLDGLRLLPPSRPPGGLLVQICRHIKIERRRAKRVHRVVIACAVATGLLLASFVAFRASPSLSLVNRQVELSKEVQNRSRTPSPSLHRRVEEAGRAIVSLTRRTADDVSANGVALAPHWGGISPSSGTGPGLLHNGEPGHDVGLGALTQPRSPGHETDLVEMALDQALEPSAQSLQGIRQDMYASLEPMAMSARRAIDFFWHEISAVENNVQ